VTNRARFIASIPLSRLGRANDVAHAAVFLTEPAAVFLTEPASGFITGVCLEVERGRCI
jgi:3-oxoacyl-[acyl-carrier protein] reductase